MFNNEKIIVSMTSYPKRITNVSKSIFFLLEKQTIVPDEIHLWLAISEFPNKEKDLPDELQIILSNPKIQLHWLDKNTYCHKRHEIFKYTLDNDCIFLIDDDVRYSDDLIQKVMETHLKFPNCIICYNQYAKHQYNGKKHIYGRGAYEDKPIPNLNRWCGQSMIPSKIYPTECLTAENQKIRDITSPLNDEPWFQPWTVLYDIPIYHLNYNWGIDIDINIKKEDGIVKIAHQKNINNLENNDIWLSNVLDNYPKIKEKYVKLFGYCIK